MSDAEFHVASYVVRARIEVESSVAARIAAMQRLEVHGVERGKLIVTAEADNVRELAAITAELEQLEGVIAVSPVYHEYLDAAGASEPAGKAAAATGR